MGAQKGFMNRIICAFAIIVISLIIGLHNLGVVFFDYDKVYELDKTTSYFTGIVLEIKSESDYKITYIIEIIDKDNIKRTSNNYNKENITNEDIRIKDLLKNKMFLLDIKIKDYNQKLEYGDVIEFYGTYNKSNEQRNYGGFDYSLYLKTQKIYGTFECSEINVISKNKGSLIKNSIISFKEYIKSNLRANLSEDEANLCIGLIIGDRTNLDENIEEDFKTSNLTHMLAVSGSHFVYIVLALTYINKLFKRKKLGQIFILIIILFFMNLTGNTGSVVRSGIMALLSILASMFYRKADLWTNMAIAILIQIVINPYIIFDIGVQLSYGGVIGIVLFNESISNVLEFGICKINTKLRKNKIINNEMSKNIKTTNLIEQKINKRIEIKNNKKESNKIIKNLIKYIKESVSVTISANIVIIPIMMLNFNTISLSFVISNLLAGAILGIIIIYAFILVFLSIIFQSFISPLFILLNILLKLLIFIAHMCSKLPFSKIYVVTPNLFLIIIFYILIYLLSRKKYSKKILIIVILLVIIFNFIFPIFTSKRSNLEINFIDVGQGDSTLIRVNNRTILVDGGGSAYGDNYDVGEMTLFPYLLDRGINKLDYVIISHFDSDHCQGLNFIMENMKVENAIISNLGQESDEYDTFINLAKKQRTNLIFVKMGDVIKIGNATINILFPENNLITDNEKNNNAIVFKFIWKDFSMLFTGDIEEKAESRILSIYSNNLSILQATILKVAHHGSKTSSTKGLLEVVKPKISLIGVGEDNNFGHPNIGVIERLESIGCRIYRTDIGGEITIKYNKKLFINTKIE